MLLKLTYIILIINRLKILLEFRKIASSDADLEKPSITSGTEILKLGLRKPKGWGGAFLLFCCLGWGGPIQKTLNTSAQWVRRAGGHLEVFTFKKQTTSHRNLIPSACVITLLSTAEQLCSCLLRKTRNISAALLGTQRAIHSSSFLEHKVHLWKCSKEHL